MTRPFVLFLLALIFTTCIKLPDEESDVHSTFTLANNQEGIAKLSWTQASISSFKYYIVVSSRAPIKLYGRIEDIPKSLQQYKIATASWNFYSDSLLTQDTYYRVFVDNGSRLIASNEVFIKTPYLYLGDYYFISSAKYDAASKRIFLTDDKEIRLFFSLDPQASTYDQRYLSSSKNLRNYGIGDLGFGAELLIPADTIMNIIEASTLNLKESIKATDCTSIAAGNDSLIYYASGAKNKIVAINRKTKKIQFEFGRSSSSDNLCKVANASEVIRIKANSQGADMDYYRFDPGNGSVIESVSLLQAIGSRFINGTKIKFSDSGNFFVAGVRQDLREYIIATKKFEQLGLIILPAYFAGGQVFCSISPDEKYIIFATSNTGAVNHEVILYSAVAPFVPVASFHSKLRGIQAVTMDDSRIYVVGIGNHPYKQSDLVSAVETIKF